MSGERGTPLTTTPIDTMPSNLVARFDVYSHHVKVTRFSYRFQKVLLDFCRTLAEMGLKKKGRYFVRGMVRVFVGVDNARSEFNFHINELERLYRFIQNHGFNTASIMVVDHPLYKPKPIKLKYIDKREPRDYQAPIINYIVEDGLIKVVTLDPGRGKTFIALSAIRDLKVRVFFCIKAMYIEKWINDAKEAFKLEKGDLIVIRGNSSLKSVIDLAQSNQLDAKIIICSNTTFQLYLKQYEKYGRDLLDVGFGCTPHDFFETLGIGLRVVDECHQDPHFNYRLDCYSHVPKTLGLSGTLTSDDRFMSKIYETMFPPEIRFNDKDSHVYMRVKAVTYQMPNCENRVKYMNHALKSYSHIKFEQSVMRQKRILTGYVNMICDIVEQRYMCVRQPGQKMLIYFATVDFCTSVSDVLKERYPDIKVTRYVSEDSYEEMLTCDLIVSTLKSLGTAIDIPGLRVALLTDALGSMQANLQCAGRLRPLKDWPDTAPEFLYLVNMNIPKHLEYHEKKFNIFLGRVVEHTVISSGYII